MASMSGDPRRVDIWRLISSVPVAYWYIGSDVWRRADLMLFGQCEFGLIQSCCVFLCGLTAQCSFGEPLAQWFLNFLTLSP